jgi:AraC family transcriptional regulator
MRAPSTRFRSDMDCLSAALRRAGNNITSGNIWSSMQHQSGTYSEGRALAALVGSLVTPSTSWPRQCRPSAGAEPHSDSLLRDGQLTSRLLKAMSQLVEAIADELGRNGKSAKDHARLASSELLSKTQSLNQLLIAQSPAPSAFRGGLAPWQVRCLTAHIDTNLHTTLRCRSLARLAGLSVSHFSRAFKDTFGCPPHMFLARRRVERTQDLMLRSMEPLAQIAAQCGFADQAHFSRVFLQLTGESPAAWRRMRWSKAE